MWVKTQDGDYVNVDYIDYICASGNKALAYEMNGDEPYTLGEYRDALEAQKAVDAMFAQMSGVYDMTAQEWIGEGE